MATITRSRMKFVGPYAELKNNGFKFQKLYASNYMQWTKGEKYRKLRIWKLGADVTIDVGSMSNYTGQLMQMVQQYMAGDLSFIPYEDGKEYVHLYIDETAKTLHADTIAYEKAKLEQVEAFKVKHDITAEKIAEKPEIGEMVNDLAELMEVEDWEVVWMPVHIIEIIADLIQKEWVELKEWEVEINNEEQA